MTELELLVDFHKDAKRQGPGSETETLKALSFVQTQGDKPLRIADIGCGTGAQTITLAQNIEGSITAVDLSAGFLAQLQIKMHALETGHKINTVKASMEDLPFQKEEFDIIWAEGSIYNMGFQKGIKEWRRFLKPGGYLAVSEITWTTNSRPDEIEDFWSNEYSEVDTASNKIQLLEEYDYSPVGYFTLPEYCWIENYYDPMEDRFERFLERHQHSDTAKNIVALHKEEIRKYKTHKDYMSYGFYIAKKIQK